MIFRLRQSFFRASRVLLKDRGVLGGLNSTPFIHMSLSSCNELHGIFILRLLLWKDLHISAIGFCHQLINSCKNNRLRIHYRSLSTGKLIFSSKNVYSMYTMYMRSIYIFIRHIVVYNNDPKNNMYTAKHCSHTYFSE